MQVFFEKLKTNERSLFLYGEFSQQRLESPFHYHQEFEILYMKRAKGKLFVGNHVINFDDDELYMFAPGLPHCFYNSSRTEKKKEPAHGFLIQFHPDFLGKEFSESDEALQLKKLFAKARFGIQISNPSVKLVEKIVKMKDYAGMKRLANLLQIFDDILLQKKMKLLTTKDSSHLNVITDSKNILDVYQYVAQNFKKGISFSKAASIAHMQRAAFCRYFKRKALKKFSTFVNEVRITHAQKLLADTDLTISEICYECGYNNLTYFNKQFKLFYKMNPLQYRKQFAF